jgi:integral membrane protein
MTSAQPPTDQDLTIRKAESALTRYRVMAIITGVMLLLLVVEMLIIYVFKRTDLKPYIAWIPFAHGWIYVVYLITVVDLWIKMRWGFGRLISLVLAGVVPVLSFIVEARVTKEARARIAAARELLSSR